MTGRGDPNGKVPAPASELLLLNNYTRTGIGDFGSNLIETLRAQGTVVRVEETGLGWGGFFGGLRRVRAWGGPMIANVGLTSWGRSGARNLLGFYGLGKAARRGRTVIVLHNLIEIIDPKDAGYRVGWAKRVGARRAIRFLRKAKVVVLSQRLKEILQMNYGMDALFLISPCKLLPGDTPSAPTRPRVVTVGYLAPYKGVETFLQVAEELRGRAEFVMVGGIHRVLATDPKFAAWHEGIRRRAAAAGVELTGYLEEEQMNALLRGSSLAILSYTSTSGASASFSTLAASGVPVIASTLPEFQLVRENGAGVVLVGPKPGEFSAAVQRLLADPRGQTRLSEMQRDFARRNSWAAFAQRLLELQGSS